MSEEQVVEEVVNEPSETDQLKAKVSEFRDNNIALQKQVDELTQKFKGVDLERYAEMEELAWRKIQDHSEGSLQWLQGMREMIKVFNKRIKRLENKKEIRDVDRDIIKSCKLEREKYIKKITHPW